MEPQPSWLHDTARTARRRLYARLLDVVRGVVDDRVGLSAPLPSARLDDLDRSVARVSQLTAGLEVQLDAISASLAPLTGPFEFEMTMAAVLRRHPGAVAVLASVGLPGCDGCAVRHDETLAEAVDAYGFDGPALLAALNALL